MLLFNEDRKRTGVADQKIKPLFWMIGKRALGLDGLAWEYWSWGIPSTVWNERNGSGKTPILMDDEELMKYY